VQELDKTFVAKNKKALLEEIAIQLSRARELIDNASLNSEAIAGSFAGLCSSVGCIEAYFKQYMLLRKGEITQQRMIGFAVFDEDDAEEFGPEDENDNEKPEKKAKKDEQATN
jgi:hypothetical protein